MNEILQIIKTNNKMKKTVLTLVTIAILTLSSFAQVAINTTGTPANTSAILDVSSTDKGLLIPRMTTSNRTNDVTPVAGLLVYDTDTESFWYYDGTQSSWVEIINENALNINGLSDGKTDDESVFLGTDAGRDDYGDNYNVAIGIQASRDNETGKRNVAIGNAALRKNENGSDLVAIGDSALYNNYWPFTSSLYSIKNTAIGSSSLFTNYRGHDNTATGYRSLYKNRDADYNTAVGSRVLYTNFSGEYNTAIGAKSMFYNYDGENNTAIGYTSLYKNDDGNRNTAIGNKALYYNEGGSNNTATGYEALYQNKVSYNTANGYLALNSDTTGAYNTAVGAKSLQYNSDGDDNTASGYKSLYNNTVGNGNTAFGSYAMEDNTTSGYNAAIGYMALANDTSGAYNTTTGAYSLFRNLSGNYNNAIGYRALYNNSTAHSNVALGVYSLYRNTDRSNLVAIGDSALFNNGIGVSQDYHATANTAIGSKALYSNTTGYDNTASGYKTMYSNIDGFSNTAVGYYTLYSNSVGNFNTAIGFGAIYYNQTGSNNTAVGYRAGMSLPGINIRGCVFLGFEAGRNNTSDNKLFIDNSTTSTPLIGGDFSTDQVNINGTIKITGGTPGTDKVLTSDASGNASWEDPEVNYWELSGGGIHNVSSDGVGIGVSFPSAKFHVRKESTANVINPIAIFEYSGSGNSAGAIRVQNSAGNKYNFGITQDTDNAFEIAYDNNISMGSGIFRITSTGDVSLDGTIKIEGGSPDIGKVLTSDADGLASWETPTTYASSLNDLSDAKTNTTGVFVGSEAGANDDGTNYNTSIGQRSMYTNTSGQHNTAFGYKALELANGESNTAIGQNSMRNTTSGNYNTAVGQGSLYGNLTGGENTSVGYGSLNSNSSGLENSAFGRSSLDDNTTGGGNTALGHSALEFNVSGHWNTAVGHGAYVASSSYSNSTAIGYNSPISGSNQIHLGNTSITEIKGQVAFTTYSDGRIKDNIKEDVAGLNFILKLRPVTYNINLDKENQLLGIIDKTDFEGKYNIEKVKRTGFIAQEVESAAKSTNYDFSGVQKPKNENDLYGLSYAEFVVPLVKGMQEQQQQIEILTTENAELKARLERLEKLLLEKN